MEELKANVRLVAKTVPVIEGLNTIEDFIVYAARVSNPSNQMNMMTGPKLLTYLLTQHHFSPFEMASATIEIKTTRDIGRQILRHRSFSFQEFSGRYAMYDMDNINLREARLQDTKNRQNSITTDDAELTDWFAKAQFDIANRAANVYKEALLRGIAKEQARAVLPEGLTPTTIYMAGTIRSWIHYIKERNRPGVAQGEHVLIARQCAEVLKPEIPSIAGLIE